MKKIFTTLLAVAVFASMSYVSAMADTKKACDRKEKGACSGAMADLKFTKEQKAKLEDIMTECKKSKIRTSADIKTVRIDLDALLKKDSIDKAAVDAKVEELGNLVKKALKAKMDCKVKALAILDAEQRKAYLESDHDCDGDHHDCGMKSGRDCRKKDDDCCGKGKDCCKKGEDCCKGTPDCCKRGDDCCKTGEDCCKKDVKGCDVKDKKAHDMKGGK